jgi:hypothetical protein
MLSYIRSLQIELPESLSRVVGWEFIPWDLVRHRHGDEPHDPLLALLKAYIVVARQINLEKLASGMIPSGSSTCLRCGTCCVHKRPGPVAPAIYDDWDKRKVPVARFYRKVDRVSEAVYDCWFHEETRLRLCPFLMLNMADGRPFCSIHHLGDENRPPRCSAFEPCPPLCQTDINSLLE